jgi:protein-S-isoprenylcysteine O-methyltransferase Ste14
LYASLILVGLGVCFKQISVVGVLFALVNVGAMIATARTEEKEMIRSFGADYQRYMKQTKMFIPYVI